MGPARHPPLGGELTASIPAWIDTWNQHPRPLVWTKTADQSLDNITRYLQRISNLGHYCDDDLQLDASLPGLGDDLSCL